VLFARKVSEGTEHFLKGSYRNWTKHHGFCLKSASEKNLASSSNFDLIRIFTIFYFWFCGILSWLLDLGVYFRANFEKKGQPAAQAGFFFEICPNLYG
jgi:hypothetical protein